MELRSLPNGTCDELVIKEDGTCEVERNTVQVTLDGSQNMTNMGSSTGQLKCAIDTPGITTTTNTGDGDTGIVCDKLPSLRNLDTNNGTVGIHRRETGAEQIVAMFPESYGSDVGSLKTYLAQNPVIVIVDAQGTTEPQSPVTLPALPAPTFNQYHDADVPSDTSTQYARDINIVLSNLESVQAALLGGE